MMQSAIATLGDDYHTMPQYVLTGIIISILYTRFIHQATCGERRFSQTLVQVPVIPIPPSHHVQKGNEVPVWLHKIQLKVSGRPRKALLKGEKDEKGKSVPFSPNLNALFFFRLLVFLHPSASPIMLHYAPFPDKLLHHVLHAGTVKQAMLYSGFIQHQSSG